MRKMSESDQSINQNQYKKIVIDSINQMITPSPFYQYYWKSNDPFPHPHPPQRPPGQWLDMLPAKGGIMQKYGEKVLKEIELLDDVNRKVVFSLFLLRIQEVCGVRLSPVAQLHCRSRPRTFRALVFSFFFSFFDLFEAH
jgi:hypothetical protein